MALTTAIIKKPVLTVDDVLIRNGQVIGPETQVLKESPTSNSTPNAEEKDS